MQGLLYRHFKDRRKLSVCTFCFDFYNTLLDAALLSSGTVLSYILRNLLYRHINKVKFWLYRLKNIGNADFISEQNDIA